MIMDKFLKFAGREGTDAVYDGTNGAAAAANDQAVTGAAGTTVSEDIADLGAGGQDLGTGENLYCVCILTQAFADTGTSTPTITAKLVAATTSALTSTGNFTHSETVGTFATTDAAGTVKYMRIPPGFGAGGRYVGGNFVKAGGVIAAGTNQARFQMFLTHDIQKWAAKANDAAAAYAT